MNHVKSLNNKAIAILRVSSARQKDNTSHEVQQSEIKEYCRGNGLELIKIEAIVESAKDSDDRKKYSAAIQYAISNSIRHILFYMYDRESRNLTDNEKNEKYVRQDLIELHYVKDRKVINKYSPDSDFFMRDIQAATNKQFIRNLSVKVNDSMRVKAESGWYPSNNPPLGYVPVKAKNIEGRDLKRGGTIGRDTNENNVKWVNREFELRSQNLSLEKIRKQIIEEKLIPQHKVAAYRIAAIDYRLKNIFYRGKFHWQGKVYEGKHELIIPLHILEKVDRINKFGKDWNFNANSNLVFSGGWIKCSSPECNCHVVYDPKIKKNRLTGKETVYHYYHCTNGKKVHTTMAGKNITEDKIWSQLGNSLDRITITEDYAKEIANAMNELQRKTKAAIFRQSEGYKRALEETHQKEDRIYSDLISGVIDQQTYERHRDAIRKDRNYYTDLLEKANLLIHDNVCETAKSILELAKEAKSLWITRTPFERRELLEKILSNPVLDGLTVRYEYKKPFATIVKMNESGEWRSYLDEFRIACLHIMSA